MSKSAKGCLWAVFLLGVLISETMLLWAAFRDELPHWWFIALRWSVCCSSVLMIYYASLIKGKVFNGILTEDLARRVVSFWNPMYTIPSILIILFNPIFQIHLGRNSWRVIDGMVSLVFPLLFFLVSKNIVENEGLVRSAARNAYKEDYKEGYIEGLVEREWITEEERERIRVVFHEEGYEAALRAIIVVYEEKVWERGKCIKRMLFDLDNEGVISQDTLSKARQIKDGP